MTKEEHLQKIKAADHAYYDLDSPIMADSEYDKLRNEYIEKYGSGDLDYVSGEAAADFEKFKHPRPVISLAKVKWETEKEKLHSEIERLWPVVHEPKLDGLTVVAYPDENGKCKFVTRGQGGLVGEVLPNFISDYEGNGVNMTGYPVRGEVFMEFCVFEQINREREKGGLPLFANPRNVAAGILRNKERSPYLDQLRYMVYDILDEGSDTEVQRLERLTNFTDFETVPFFCGDTVEDEIKMIEHFYTNYADGNVPIDGIVVKSNQAGSLKKWGSTNHHPRNAFAVKFQQEQVETVLRDVIWQVGRDSITPVAIMDPVELDGSVISRASLHNWANIKRLKLNRNDRVIIEKANEIIPQIVENKGHGLLFCSSLRG